MDIKNKLSKGAFYEKLLLQRYTQLDFEGGLEHATDGRVKTRQKLARLLRSSFSLTSDPSPNMRNVFVSFEMRKWLEYSVDLLSKKRL